MEKLYRMLLQRANDQTLWLKVEGNTKTEAELLAAQQAYLDAAMLVKEFINGRIPPY